MQKFRNDDHMKWILLLIIVFLDLTIAFTQNTMVDAHKNSKLNLIEVYQYLSLIV
ncbi:hypothetical protein [Carboxylicivirga caseinilyticus]|uniref:hypothetical protein n=1 Tax=Carboxylicivirga caseinilyticus TaxID=3417572 RepID=UPI003D349E1E|nr:hypothetical protein [Marinilabiliaceae bacterium A049]